MIPKYKTAIFMALCGLMTAYSFAADEINHTAVGTRSESSEQQVERLKQRDQAGAEELAKSTTSNKKRRKRPSKANEMSSKHLSALSAAKSVRYTTHPGAYQNPVSVSYLGDSIELTDGSIWTVASYDGAKTINWFPSDVVVITPNRNWFSAYGFRLTNQNTGESVASNLYLGPIDPAYGSLYTRWISAIDYYHDTIYLNDGSVWKMSFFDRGAVDQWMVNDVVIIGVNDGWFCNYNPNILINVNVLNYAAGIASF